MDPSLKQFSGGPGRGLFQFEEGNHSGGITAAKRTKQYLEHLGEEIPDASKLNADQQKMLFLGNMRMHPRADFSKVWKGDESIEDFWANYHWAGPNSQERKKRRAFKESYKAFTEKNPITPSFTSEFTKYNSQEKEDKGIYTNQFPDGGPTDPPNKEIVKGKEFVSNWFKHPETLRRYKENTGYGISTRLYHGNPFEGHQHCALRTPTAY